MDPVVSVQSKYLSGNTKRTFKSSWSRIGSLKSITLTVEWNLARPVKVFAGIIARQRHTDHKQMGMLREQCAVLQSGLDEKWWADSVECYTYLRHIQHLLSDGKTPYERRFGEPLKGPIIPFGSLVEYHPITAKDQSRIHQFRKKVLPALFLGCALYAGGIWKGDVLIADLEELETMDSSENSTPKDSTHKR